MASGRAITGLLLAGLAVAACGRGQPPAWLNEPPKRTGPSTTMVLTFDDVPVHMTLPPGMTRTGIMQSLTSSLKAAGVPEAYGFINAGAQAENAADGTAAIAAWRAAYPLGNHGWQHQNLNDIDVATFEQQLLANEPVLKRLGGDSDWHWFRYPYLSEGDDPAKRAAARAVLVRHGYKIAAVTTDFADYAYNDPYARCLAKNDAEAITVLEDNYLAAAREGLRASREMARTAYGREVPQILIMHVGAFDARMLPRLLALYREEGVAFTSLAEAQKDPIFASANDPRLPGGTVNLHEAVRAKGGRVPQVENRMPMLEAICR